MLKKLQKDNGEVDIFKQSPQWRHQHAQIEIEAICKKYGVVIEVEPQYAIKLFALPPAPPKAPQDHKPKIK